MRYFLEKWLEPGKSLVLADLSETPEEARELQDILYQAWLKNDGTEPFPFRVLSCTEREAETRCAGGLWIL